MAKNFFSRNFQSGFLRKIYDNQLDGSWASNLRKRRCENFFKFTGDLKRPVRILDAGGTEEYWRSMQLDMKGEAEVFLLNLETRESASLEFHHIVGDICDMSQFRDHEFDIVFSNSVIEHLWTFEAQRKAADEIRRVGKRYFIQTPNYFFPIEPHFVFPFFQFLPRSVRIFLVSHFDLGWCRRAPDRKKAEEMVDSIRLLKKSELRGLFPGDVIEEERFLGLVKSFIIKSSERKEPSS